jgi:hypothetical protein
VSAVGRGSAPASKSNLAKGRKASPGKNFGPDPKAMGAKGAEKSNAKQAADRKDVAQAGDAFAEGKLLEATEMILVDVGANLAALVRKERNQTNLGDGVTARMEAARKLINDAIRYRELLTTDSPAEAIAEVIATRLAQGNFSEESPDPAPLEDDDDEPSA